MIGCYKWTSKSVRRTSNAVRRHLRTPATLAHYSPLASDGNYNSPTDECPSAWWDQFVPTPIVAALYGEIVAGLTTISRKMWARATGPQIDWSDPTPLNDQFAARLEFGKIPKELAADLYKALPSTTQELVAALRKLSIDVGISNGANGGQKAKRPKFAPTLIPFPDEHPNRSTSSSVHQSPLVNYGSRKPPHLDQSTSSSAHESQPLLSTIFGRQRAE